MSEEDNKDVEIAEMRDAMETMMTSLQNMKQRLDAMSPHSAPNRPASAPAPRAPAQSQSQLQPSGEPSAPANKAWFAKDIVPDKYDPHQSPQDAFIALKGFLDDLNAVSPVIEALSKIDASNVQQVSSWAQTNRDTIYTLSDNFTARADSARKSLSRVASYVDWLKDKAYNKGQGQGQGRQGYSSSSYPQQGKRLNPNIRP